MLPRRKRVGKALFSLVFKEGTAVHSPHLFLKVLKTAGTGRFSVVVGKNAAKKATERNRLRRRGYALLSKRFSAWPDGVSGIIFIKKKLPLRETEEELALLLRRAKLA
ncbi:MAG: ribonuclease P protein component [bacterium]|nr:ribonuclease P protein component [bacterium]